MLKIIHSKQIMSLSVLFLSICAHSEGIQPTHSVQQVSKSSTALNSNPISKNIVKADQLPEAEKQNSQFSLSTQISQSRNLIDFKDGTRQDALEIQAIPKLATAIGSFSSKIIYSRDMNNSENVDNGFADTTFTYGIKPTDWQWKSPYVIFLAPSITVALPTSKASQKKTQLQSATIIGLTLGVRPDGIGKSDGTWNFSFGLTGGRNFHKYEEDINGAILNQYSSNQSLSFGYSISDWSITADFLNRSRWTYQNNVRQSFILSQEISYAISENFGLAVGHTNESSALKANGQDSNLNIIDEKTSTIYGSVGVSY